VPPRLLTLAAGLAVAVLIAGGLLIATVTSIGVWKYVLAVLGLLIFVVGGLAFPKERQ
jgi:hypothetical protein